MPGMTNHFTVRGKDDGAMSRAVRGFVVGAGVTLVVILLARGVAAGVNTLWPTPDANIGLGLLLFATEIVLIPLGTWLTLRPPADTGLELFARRRVLVEREPVTDHDFRPEYPAREQLTGPLEAVQHRHRADDPDLLVVDLVRLEAGHRLLRRDTELLERPAGRHPAEPVLDRGHDTGAVDDDVPAARPIPLVRAGHGRGAAQQPGRP